MGITTVIIDIAIAAIARFGWFQFSQLVSKTDGSSSAIDFTFMLYYYSFTWCSDGGAQIRIEK